MDTNTYPIGALVKVYANFYDEDGVLSDPEVVNLSVRDPDGTVTTYVYETDDEVEKDSTGAYHANIDGNLAGFWHYRWWATGDGQAADEHRFEVEDAEAIES